MKPFHAPFLAREAQKLRLRRQDIEEISRHPGRLDAGEITRPLPIAGAELDCRHDAGMADREHQIPVHDRPSGDVVELGKGRHVARAREHVAPGGAPVLHAQRIKLARGIGAMTNSPATAALVLSRMPAASVIP